MNWAATASILLALAVVLDAFGVHGLHGRLDAYHMGLYEKAVFYQFVQALGMLTVSVLRRTGTSPSGRADLVCWLLLAGIAIFCGSLYLLAVTGTRALGAITPLGGASFIAAWLLLAWGLLRRP
jgi:uncharacterized membrane protein YgdD (TMEM256/DUF423 family)